MSQSQTSRNRRASMLLPCEFLCQKVLHRNRCASSLAQHVPTVHENSQATHVLTCAGVTLVPQKKHNRPPPQRKRTSVSIADSDTCSSSDSHDRSNSRSAAVSSTSDDFAADEAQTDRKRKRETLQPGASERSAPPIRRKTTQARDHGHDSWRHRWETRGHMCALDAPSHSVPMRELYSHQSTLHIDLENRTAWQEITVPCSGEDAAAYHVLRKACASYMKECSVVTNIEEVPDKVGNVVVSFQIPSVILKSLPQLQVPFCHVYCPSQFQYADHV